MPFGVPEPVFNCATKRWCHWMWQINFIFRNILHFPDLTNYIHIISLCNEEECRKWKYLASVFFLFCKNTWKMKRKRLRYKAGKFDTRFVLSNWLSLYKTTFYSIIIRSSNHMNTFTAINVVPAKCCTDDNMFCLGWLQMSRLNVSSVIITFYETITTSHHHIAIKYGKYCRYSFRNDAQFSTMFTRSKNWHMVFFFFVFSFVGLQLPVSVFQSLWLQCGFGWIFVNVGSSFAHIFFLITAIQPYLKCIKYWHVAFAVGLDTFIRFIFDWFVFDIFVDSEEQKEKIIIYNLYEYVNISKHL